MSSRVLPYQQLIANPVLGRGREERWETVVRIIRTRIESPQQSLLDQTSADLSPWKCRLLTEGETPKGVLFALREKTPTGDLEIRLCPEASSGHRIEAVGSSLATLFEELRKEADANRIVLKIWNWQDHMLENLRLAGFEDRGMDGQFHRLVKPQPAAPALPSLPPRRPIPISIPGTRPNLKRRNEDEEGSVDKVAKTSGAATEIKEHSCPLKMQYLRLILSGKKTVEGRINSGMFRHIRAGDQLRFFCGETQARCSVLSVVSYGTFREMLEKEGVEKCLPGVPSLDQGARIYDDIPGYAEKARQHGVLAIRIRLS